MFERKHGRKTRKCGEKAQTWRRPGHGGGRWVCVQTVRSFVSPSRRSSAYFWTEEAGVVPPGGKPAGWGSSRGSEEERLWFRWFRGIFPFHGSSSGSCASCMFPPEPDMPMDITIPYYSSKEEFVFTTTSTVQKSVRSSCSRFPPPNCVNKTQPEDGAVTNKETKKKKRVTFADHKGSSLTKVKIFSKFTDPIEIPVNIQEMLSSKLTSSSTEEDKSVSDFTQPSSDYLSFRQNSEKNLVSSEHCVSKEKAFAGTVKVKNVSFEKSVMLRVTFDSWRSHTDVSCEYVKDTYPTSYSDTFSYEVSSPAELRPNEQVEFAVCYRVNGNEYWDSNQGKNYRVVWSHTRKNRHSDSSSHFGIHFDRYGSPTCSHGLFPDWPSYAGYENIGPYY